MAAGAHPRVTNAHGCRNSRMAMAVVMVVGVVIMAVMLTNRNVFLVVVVLA